MSVSIKDRVKLESLVVKNISTLTCRKVRSTIRSWSSLTTGRMEEWTYSKQDSKRYSEELDLYVRTGIYILKGGKPA